MTTYLEMGEYKENLVDTRSCITGIQHLFKFQNNYGASVITCRNIFGDSRELWELAVIRYDDTGAWGLDYSTEITRDVVGYQTDEEIRDLLGQIKNLDEPKDNET